MGRVIGLGLDSGSIGLIEELIAAGGLPHLAALRSRSARVALDSDPTFRHAVLWPQFSAGAEARFGGQWRRFHFDRSTYEVSQTGARHVMEGNEPFWERSDLRTITMDIPGSTVCGPGVHVTGWGAHAPLYPRASQPQGLLTELDDRIGVHPAYENEYDVGWHDPSRLDRLTDALVTGAQRGADIAIDLMRRFPDWELFLSVMSESHSASEMMWQAVASDHPLADFDAKARTRLERVFGAMDAAIGKVVDQAPPDATIAVFSLDGMRGSNGDLPSIVLLPELMHRMHFGTPKLTDLDVDEWRSAGCPPLVTPRGRPWRLAMDARLVDPPTHPWTLRLPGYQAARLTKPGRWLLERLKRQRLGAFGIEIPPESTGDPETFVDHDGPADSILFIDNYRSHRHEMRAFVLPTFGDAYIRINLIGREADGVVPVEEFDAECKAVAAMIASCRDVRTGEPLAESIEILPTDDPLDPTDDRYCDIFVTWNRPVDAIEHPTAGVIGPFPFNRTGAHDARGFAWVAGDGVKPGPVAGVHSVLDLPPTIVKLVNPNAAMPPAGTPIEQLLRSDAAGVPG